MHGEEGLEVTRDDAPLAPEIDRPQLLELDPMTDARLRHLNQLRNLLHGEESPRQHRVTPVRRLPGPHGRSDRDGIALTCINAR
jgi:hypothetical protein